MIGACDVLLAVGVVEHEGAGRRVRLEHRLAHRRPMQPVHVRADLARHVQGRVELMVGPRAPLGARTGDQQPDGFEPPKARRAMPKHLLVIREERVVGGVWG